ncbi:iron transporter [Planotetraspora sp. A-T 1434]|uniref:IucA/IucC family protein n=1 Tax=Planotetraspora sp. A-T 1434 TaxID=2979219 RepID=UPI0021BF3AC7|nr:IucA/IucC family protein [Planotetraspora sp. A-T 1434]MCT9932545.1 iron transporter [Planotetraspora sp. A-T 1434]
MDRLLIDPHTALAEGATLAALLRCCAREVCGPRGQVWAAEPYLMLRVAGALLRVRARGGIALRFDGPPEWLADGSWLPLTSDLLLELVERELTEHGPAEHGPAEHRLDGVGQEANDEFAAQVVSSRDAIATILSARAEAAEDAARASRPPRDPWLASEQALVYGHPFHPSPKARTGSQWPLYAPETHAEFPLRLLGVRSDLVAGQGDAGVLDRLGTAPPGYALLPAHPWQLDLLAGELREPLGDGRLIDLGYGSRPVIPTSSVRTVYEPGTGSCLKFSLDVRITNCVRKNAWYELIGAVELTERLRPAFERLADAFPGTRWLPEPGYRSAALGTRRLEGLGVIVRSGPWAVCGPGVTPILAAALAAPPYGMAEEDVTTAAGVPDAVRARRAGDPLTWWRAYVERVAPPVLDAYFTHGVVLEPHVQNVLVGVDDDGLPVEAIFRDLEGTKLVAGRHDLSGLPGRVAEALTYEAGRGWDRVVYCLVVNHLAEVAATVAEPAAKRASLLDRLWEVARDVLARYADEHGRPVPLAGLLAGAPLPAKANLGARWARSADSAAGYVPVANPLGGYWSW